MKKTISILLFTVIIAVCSAQCQKYSFSENYNVDVPTQLSVDLKDGNISIISSNEGDIMINYIAKINNKLIKIDRAELEKHFTIEIIKSQNSIAIHAKPTHIERNKKWSNRIILSIEVMVPNATSCDLNTVDGNISIIDLNADQECKTVDGNIHLYSIKGIVSATTTDGNISFKDIDGEFTAFSHDGNLSGSLSVLTEDISVRTNDGDIKVILPEGLGLNLDLRADDIDTNFEDFIGQIGDEYIKGTLKGGGISVNISTSDGDLTLDFE